MTSTRKGLRILQDHLPVPDDGSIVCAKCGEPAPCPAVAGVMTDWKRQPDRQRWPKYSLVAPVLLNLWFLYLGFGVGALAHGVLIAVCALVYGWMWERYG